MSRPRKHSGKRRRSIRLLWTIPLWLLFVFLLMEGGVRVAALVLARDSATPIANAGDAGVIYSIGDSFTYGLRVDDDQAYPKVLERLLKESGASESYEVRNLGYPGLSSSNAVYAVKRAIEAGDATLILVLAGWNVNDTDFQRLAEEKNRPVRWTTRLDTFAVHLRSYRLIKHLATLRSRTAVLDGIEIVPQAESMDLYNFREYQEIAKENLRKIARLGRDFSAPLVFLNYPYQDLPANPYSKNEYYHVVFGRTPISPDDYITERLPDEIGIHAVIRHVAAEEGIPIVDLHEVFLRSGRTDLFQEDLHHPTAAGHELIASTVFDALW